MLAGSILSACLMLHGGQYLPPLPDPDAPTETQAGLPTITQPGFGPALVFSPARWEWWFDFNQEGVLDLADRLARAGGRYVPVTSTDRSRDALPALVDALRSGHRDVRASATVALGRLGSASAVPFVEVMVEDPDLFVRTQAILALGIARQGTGVEVLGDVFRDEDRSAEERTYALAGLGLVGDDESMDILRQQLDPRRLGKLNNQLRAAAVYAAGVSRRVELVPALLALDEEWIFENEAPLRALVAVALGQLGDAEGLPLVLRLLEDDDNQVRRSAAAALEGLAEVLDEGQVAGLVEHWKAESDVPVRINLLRALGLSGRPAGRAFLLKILGTGTSLERPHAALALGLAGDRAAAPELIAALTDEHEVSNRAAIVLALGLTGAPEAVEPVAGMLDREREPALRAFCCLSLGLLGGIDQEVVDRIEGFAESSTDVEVVRYATMALGLLGQREAVARLAIHADEVESTVGRAARLHALGLVGDRNTLPRLLGFLEDDTQPSYVVAYALQAVGEVCDPRRRHPSWQLSRHVELSHDVGFLFELYRLL